MKQEALRKLALVRQDTRYEGYACIGDFHDGLFECEYISPWTKSGCNVDAALMIIGQDWIGSDYLSKDPPNNDTASLGFDPNLPTNRNLDRLLKQHLEVTRAECYLTNLFPFVKSGDASASIKMKDMVASARRFTLKEIEIVSPKIAVCLGLQTFTALMRATGLNGSPKMDEAVSSPFKFANTMIHCLAHTGALGTNNRNRVPGRVDDDWERLAQSLRW